MNREKTELPTYLPLGWAESPRVLMYKSHCVEVCRPFRTWGRDSPGCEGINPFANVFRPFRAWVAYAT
jgi:hypothetical protein